jgi:hypothetical protein
MLKKCRWLRQKRQRCKENSYERELIQKRMAKLTGFKERMLAWDAHKQKVTEEWSVHVKAY